MAILLPSNPAALVLDANTLIALSSRETGRDAVVTTELTRYTAAGYDWYAPGVIVAETLYVLCGKRSNGALSPAAYATAVQAFEATMSRVLPPPHGEGSLIARAEQIGSGYGCRRSADGLYIALAEQLTQLMPTVLLTFDQGVPNQAARNAPSVTVQLL